MNLKVLQKLLENFALEKHSSHTHCVSQLNFLKRREEELDELPTSTQRELCNALIHLTHKFSSRPERLLPICQKYNLDHTATLENIIYARAYTHEHQDNLVNAVAAKMVCEFVSTISLY